MTVNLSEELHIYDEDYDRDYYLRYRDGRLELYKVGDDYAGSPVCLSVTPTLLKKLIDAGEQLLEANEEKVTT